MLATFDYPNSLETEALGINSKGEIVGLYVDSDNAVRGFLLSNGFYYSIDFPLAANTRAFSINDAGAIAGTLRYADKIDHGFAYSRGVFSQVMWLEVRRWNYFASRTTGISSAR